MKTDLKTLKEDISEFEKTLNDDSLDPSTKLIITTALNNAKKKLQSIEGVKPCANKCSKEQSKSKDETVSNNSESRKKTSKAKSTPKNLSIARDQINKIAREIRKPNEKWNQAVKRASQIYKEKKSGVTSMDTPEKNISKKDVPIAKTDIPNSKEVKEPSKEIKEEKQKLLPLEKQELGKLVLTEALKQRGITQEHIDIINKTKEGIVLVEYLDVIDNTESKEDDKKRKAMKLGLRVSRHGLIYSERRTNRGDRNPRKNL